MYFVNQQVIEKKLEYMGQYLHFFGGKKEWSTFADRLTLERVAHIVIEAIIDVGNDVIDGFVMRDPGSYEDIIEILLDERVIEEAAAKSYKKVLSLRAMVVRDYTEIDHDQLQVILGQNLDMLKAFPGAVRRYLQNESQQVTAFIPKA